MILIVKVNYFYGLLIGWEVVRMDGYEFQIVIPAYDGIDVIGDTLNSIYKNKGISNPFIRVICNGCKDGTEALIKAYQENHPNLFLYEFSNRIGRLNAINHALSDIPYECPVLVIGQEQQIEGEIGTFHEVSKRKKLVLPRIRTDLIHIEGEEGQVINAYNRIRAYINNGSLSRYGVFGFGMNGRRKLPNGLIPFFVLDDDVITGYYSDEEVGVPNMFVVESYSDAIDIESIIRKRARIKAGIGQIRDAVERGDIPTPRVMRDRIEGTNFHRTNPIDREKAREMGMVDEYEIYLEIDRLAKEMASLYSDELIEYWLGEEFIE